MHSIKGCWSTKIISISTELYFYLNINKLPTEHKGFHMQIKAVRGYFTKTANSDNLH